MENVRFGRRFFVDAASGLRYDEYENTGRRINAWGLKSWASRGRSVRRRYEGAANWGEWWENGWFETLEKIPALPFNGDAYIGARREAGVERIAVLELCVKEGGRLIEKLRPRRSMRRATGGAVWPRWIDAL